jgi:hypothetical protein
MLNDKYPDAERFSKTIKIHTKNLIEAFEVENIFHNEILNERPFDK